MACKKIKVRQGDCISSIAFKYKLLPQTIWDHPDNKELKDKRKDPNALLPGDIVMIPEPERKEESCSPEQKHTFKRKGVPEKLKIQFLSGDEEDDSPRKNMPYTLEITTKNGKKLPEIEANTDGDGFLEESIPPDAWKGKIILGEDEEDQETYEILLGHLDPIDTITGVKERLQNLGFECGDNDKPDNPQTLIAIRRFQAENDLEILTGDFSEIDQDTLDTLEKIYTAQE